MDPSGGQRTVLVVEDDPLLRAFYRSALIIGGYRVVTAENGIEALHCIEGYQPDAVVLDLGLPLLSGHEVRRELAAHIATRNIPVVVVTGDPGDFDPEEFPCVLRKPVTADSLIDAIEKCLQDRG